MTTPVAAGDGSPEREELRQRLEDAIFSADPPSRDAARELIAQFGEAAARAQREPLEPGNRDVCQCGHYRETHDLGRCAGWMPGGIAWHGDLCHCTEFVLRTLAAARSALPPLQMQENKEDARVEPFNPRVAPAGSTAEVSPGNATAAERTDRKIEFVQDGEWIDPTPQIDHRMICCDCGLVHHIDFRIEDGRVNYRAQRDDAESAAWRKEHPFAGELLPDLIHASLFALLEDALFADRTTGHDQRENWRLGHIESVTQYFKLDAMRAALPRVHRCSGCGHRWNGDLPGVELCGDCWRTGQDVILGAGDDASREAATRMSVRGPSPLLPTVVDLDAARALARTHRGPTRDLFAESLSAMIFELADEVDGLRAALPRVPEPDTLDSLLEKLEKFYFPIMDGPRIPWTVIAPHERQAQRNHSQTLLRLAQRGGLSPDEAVAVLEDREWQHMDEKVAKARLNELVRAARAEPASPRVPEPDLGLPDVEIVSAEVHEAWIASKRAQGVTTRRSESGEELMVPYSQLSDAAKELDRGTVRAVYVAIVRAVRAGADALRASRVPEPDLEAFLRALHDWLYSVRRTALSRSAEEWQARIETLRASRGEARVQAECTETEFREQLADEERLTELFDAGYEAGKRADRAGEPVPPRCAWDEDEDGVWRTDCGHTWTFEDAGAPNDHEARFCFYCGLPITAHTYATRVPPQETPE